MPISDATTGHGSQLWINVSGTLTKVAEIDDIPELPTSSERELYETTNFDTVDWKEWKKHPLRDGTTITITGNYVINSASDTLLQGADDALEPLPYRVIVPQGADVYHVDGTGLFFNLKRMNPKDGKRTFSIQLKPTAEAAITEAP